MKDGSKKDIDRTIAIHLADKVRRWRRQYGLTLREMGAMTDIPPRTLESIEQGRGFRYPNLLSQALLGIESQARLIKAGAPLVSIGYQDDTSADAGTGGEGARHRRGHAGGDAESR